MARDQHNGDFAQTHGREYRECSGIAVSLGLTGPTHRRCQTAARCYRAAI